MKQNLLQALQLSFCFLILSLQVGFAQSPKHLNGEKFKTAEVLRELDQPVASFRAQTLSLPSAGPQILDLLQIQDGYVGIEAVADSPDGQELLRQLQKLGLKNGVYYKRVVSGFFPIDKISELEIVKPLTRVVPAYRLQHSVGAVTSQGDAALYADKARSKFTVNGAGSKIGIISDSYSADAGGVAAGIASGDLPADAQIIADIKNATDEGRAMAEIVHDVAPGAKIAFHSAMGGQAAFAAGIQRLARAGCNIVVDDVIYYTEPMFQDGIVAQSVEEVVRNNVTYFSAAGNANRQSYQSAYLNSGKPLIIDDINYGIPHDFGNGDITQSIRIPAGGSFLIPFQWDDPFYSVSGGRGARTDMDVLVFYNGNLLTSLSSMADNIGGDPVELIGLSANSAITIEIVITKYTGPDPRIIKWVNFGNAVPLEHVTASSTIYGHANARNSIAVGATAWFNTPAFNKNITRPVINRFSSVGGTPIVISPTGQRTIPGQSNIRRKPEVVGPDGGNTTFFGNDIPQDADVFPNFFGTSAAAPHVAAVAALMQQIRRNSLSPEAILENLISTAIDMDDPSTPGFDAGFDFQTGYGFVATPAVLENTRVFNCSLSLTTKVRQGLPGNPGSIDLTVRGGSGPYTYQWNSGTATEDLPRALPGRYTVTVTDATGCLATTTVNVGVAGSPLTLTSAHINVSRPGAADGSIDLSVIGGTGPYTYKWNNGIATEDLPWVTRGFYTVWVTDVTGATAYTTVFVSADGEPLALQTAHNNASARGANDGSIDLTVIGGVGPYTYKWNAGATTEDLPRVTPGLYNVTVTDATGATVTTSVYVSVKGQPLALYVDYIDASRWGADDGSINLTVIGGVGPYQYRWNAGSTREDLPRVLPGLYSVTVTDATGATASISVRVGVKEKNNTLATNNPEFNFDLDLPEIKKTSLTAYPNPTASQAAINVNFSQDTEYALDVYDIKGSLVKNLEKGRARAGKNLEAHWEPKDNAKGIYIIRLTTQHEVQNLRLVVK